jgi:glycosyltransferase involved in cell wall biosynthesis
MDQILIVAHDFPFPPTHGGRVDMWSRIKMLQGLGCQVDLVTSVKEEPDEAAQEEVRRYVRSLMIVKREMGVRQLFSLEPLSVRSRRNLARIPLSNSYAAIILETEHVAPILQNPALRADKTIVRLQNDESQYYAELSDASRELWRKIFYRLEGLKFRFFSPRVLRACDLLWFISDFERQQYCVEHPRNTSKALFVPPHVSSVHMKRHTLNTNRVLFVGRLGFATNTRGIEWYIQQVHPALADIQSYELAVAGSTGGEPLDTLRHAIAGQSNISLHEDLPELRSLYGAAAVFINPVFQGTGLKLKTIDAIQAGLPVVSTAIGIQGTGLLDGQHVLVADSPERFAACIRRLLRDRSYAEKMVSEAQAFISSKYDQSKIFKQLFEGRTTVKDQGARN